MIICLCHGINCQSLKRLTQEGCNTLKSIQKKCQAGTSCGACIPQLLEALPCQTENPDALAAEASAHGR